MSSEAAPPVEPSWGLGDVAVGYVAALVLSVIGGSFLAAIFGWGDDTPIPMWGMALLQVPLWGGYLGAVFAAGRRKGNGVVVDFGLRTTALDVPVGLVIGVAMQLLVVPWLYIPVLWLSGMSREELSAPAQRLADRADGPVGWILFALIVGVGAPLVEELFYRGLLLRSLQRRGFSDVAAVVLSAAVFGVVHFQLLQFFGLFSLGVVLAALVVRTGRLGAAIWAHVGFNLTTVLVLYLESGTAR